MFSLLLPFHQDTDKLLASIPLIEQRSTELQIDEIIFCHNGAWQSLQAQKNIEALAVGKYRLLHTEEPGLGAGLRTGIREASSPYLILSACDLPYGLSEVEQFIELLSQGVSPKLFAIGSKGHTQSQISNYPSRRKAASFVLYLIRRLLFGPNTPKDSQGTLIFPRTLCQQIARQTKFNSFSFLAEITTLAIAQGHEFVELPISLITHSQGDSSVSLLRDGPKMLTDLILLKMRLLTLKKTAS